MVHVVVVSILCPLLHFPARQKQPSLWFWSPYHSPSIKRAIVSSELYMHVSCLTVVLVVIYMYMYMLTVYVPLTYLCTVTRYVNYHISKHIHTIPGSIDDINTPAKVIRELQQGWLLCLIQSHYRTTSSTPTTSASTSELTLSSSDASGGSATTARKVRQYYAM